MRVPPRMTNNQTNNPNNNTPDEPTRRSFLAKLWIALGIVAIIEIIGLIIAFFSSNKPRPAVSDTELLVEAGPVEKFALNSVTAFVRGQFYLCRLEDGGFLALSRKCTHLGCTVPWVAEENTFVCPCHSSAFNIQGEVVSPPAPRPLDQFPLFIENNIVTVDTRTPLKRNAFQTEQVVYVKNGERPRLNIHHRTSNMTRKESLEN
jgi:cytochrome b6-f complex iron-sulfur subunit